jgi:hypothetical protein
VFRAMANVPGWSGPMTRPAHLVWMVRYSDREALWRKRFGDTGGAR